MSVEECLCFNLGLAHRRVSRVFEEALSPLGLTMAQAHFLSCLFGQDAQRSVELSRSLGVDACTLTPMVDRLERLALIRRCPDPDDRRATRICLEPAAWEMKPELESRLQGATERLKEKFSAEEYASLLLLVQRLASEDPCLNKLVAKSAAGG